MNKNNKYRDQSLPTVSNITSNILPDSSRKIISRSVYRNIQVATVMIDYIQLGQSI